MDSTPHHSLEDLFAQLGLPGDAASQRSFVLRHRPLADDLRLSEAPFWSPSQAAFLREQLRADGEWALAVDSLNAMLREHTPPEQLPQAEAVDSAAH